MRSILPAYIPPKMGVWALWAPATSSGTKHVKQNEHCASQWAYLFTTMWSTHSHKRALRAVFNFEILGVQSQVAKIGVKCPFCFRISFVRTRNFFRIPAWYHKSFSGVPRVSCQAHMQIWKSVGTLTVHQKDIFLWSENRQWHKTFRRSPENLPPRGIFVGMGSQC